ncbi:MAG: M23 family metallopeptidase [Rickettsiales bacterium]|nr:M23 family metallopeptidase [Rickettsiales bacterium]
MKINSIIFQTAFLALMALLCASCGHKKSIPIVNHNKSFYNKSSSSGKNKYAENKPIESNKKITNKTNTEANSTLQEVEIGSGDTLYSISKKYQTPLRDIIEANNLSAPYSLKLGSKIIIPQPTYYKVKAGDTLYSVSRDWQMKINDIVALNDLRAPYKLNAGQLIKIKNNGQTTVANENKKLVVQNEESSSKQGAIVSSDLSQNSPPIVEKILEHKNNKFSWPIKGSIISRFGPKKGGLYNDGLNITAKEGSLVKASEDGLSAYVGNELKGYGNLIIIKHSDGWITAYAHLSKSLIKRGEKIKKGQTIGAVGSTGNVDSPQLYFGLRKGRDAVNPENYLTQ